MNWGARRHERCRGTPSKSDRLLHRVTTRPPASALSPLQREQLRDVNENNACALFKQEASGDPADSAGTASDDDAFPAVNCTHLVSLS